MGNRRNAIQTKEKKGAKRDSTEADDDSGMINMDKRELTNKEKINDKKYSRISAPLKARCPETLLTCPPSKQRSKGEVNIRGKGNQKRQEKQR